MPEQETRSQGSAISGQEWHELQARLDQELSRLSDKYRVAIVLCDLEGKTRKEAARQLGVPEGTVAARLTRGRLMLAKRLARRGLALSAGALAALVSENAATAAPTTLVSSTIKAATLLAAGPAAAGISAKVAALTEGMVKAMLLKKLKMATAVLAVLAMVLTAGGLLYHTEAATLPDAPRLAGGAAKSDQKPAVAKLNPRQFVERLEWTLLDLDELNSALLVDDFPNFDEGTRKAFAKLKDDGAPIPDRLRLTPTELLGLSARLPFDAQVKVTLDGKEIKRDELKPGMGLTLTLDKAGAVVKIDAKTKRKQIKGPGLKWTVKQSDAKALTLSVGCEENGVEVRAIPLAENAKILVTDLMVKGDAAFPRSDYGTIEDLQAGRTVALRLRSDKDRGIILSEVQTTK